MASTQDVPAPLRLPAILQNQKDTSRRQVEAYNAQQRERLQARRERESRVSSGVKDINGQVRGKRVVRRIDNASFVDNPHIIAPLRSDLLPSVPLHPRPHKPSFPESTIPRSLNIPNVNGIPADPTASSSKLGGFQTSLKGVRQLLRKRGRRAEVVVERMERELRGWLGGDYGSINLREREGEGREGREGSWKVIDETLVDLPSGVGKSSGDGEDGIDGNGEGEESGLGSSPEISTSLRQHYSKRLPPQHQPPNPLPGLPSPIDDSAKGKIPAIMELSRSPVHLTLCVVESFDRLITHLLARYYECSSWSEDHPLPSGLPIRLTHIIQPTRLRPTIISHSLITPETSDQSDLSDHPSSSENTIGGSSSEYDYLSSSSGGEGSETPTERGSVLGTDNDDDEEGYSLEAEVGERLVVGLNQVKLNNLKRSESRGSIISQESDGSSMYASSEADSDLSGSVMGDSLTLPPLKINRDQSTIVNANASGGINDTWVEVDERLVGRSIGNLGIGRNVQNPIIRRSGEKSWEDKQTFFEYLYGN